jgi:hypothetical protein
MKKLDIYIAGALLLGVGILLKSPTVAVSSVVLWGLSSAEASLLSKNRDADIVALVTRAESYEKKLKELTQDVTNVAERAKTILGEQF